MTRRTEYREQLRAQDDWRAFLLAHSNLPGPRGNLELMAAFADECSRPLALDYAKLAPDQAPENTPECFLACCGVVGLGRFAAEGRKSDLPLLRRLASDPRWRVRESVAMALQRLGDADVERLLDVVEEWAGGNELERRAAIAAICEPRLLGDPAHAGRVLALLDRVTTSIAEAHERKSESYRVLRQALAYCWSVAVAAYPAPGRAAFSKWLSSTDRDVRTVLKENLKKKRLASIDPAWAETALAKLS